MVVAADLGFGADVSFCVTRGFVLLREPRVGGERPCVGRPVNDRPQVTKLPHIGFVGFVLFGGTLLPGSAEFAHAAVVRALVDGAVTFEAGNRVAFGSHGVSNPDLRVVAVGFVLSGGELREDDVEEAVGARHAPAGRDHFVYQIMFLVGSGPKIDDVAVPNEFEFFAVLVPEDGVGLRADNSGSESLQNRL